MWKTTPVTIFFLVALMPWLDPPGVLLFKWDLSNSSAILISALLGFLLQWSGALALGWDFIPDSHLQILSSFNLFNNSLFFGVCRATSATSHVVLGQFKTCVILLGGYLLFNSDPGFVSICGAVTALGGMSIYTSLNLQKSQEASNKQIPKHNVPLPKPNANTEDSIDSDAAKTPNIVVI